MNIWGMFLSWLDVHGQSLYRSLREVLVNVLITLTPVWAGVLITIVISEDKSIFGAIRLNSERGDLFVLATALIAPIILYVTAEKGNLPKPFSFHFLGGWFYVVVVYVIAFVCAVLFSIKRISDAGMLELHKESDITYNVSIWLYLISILVAFIVTFQRMSIERASPELFRANDTSFIAEWQSRGED